PLLAASFLDELAAEHGRRLVLAPDALELLVAHDWPGNVRQLRNTLERLVVAHGEGAVTRADLEWLRTATPTATPTPTPTPTPTERDRILDALSRAGHVQARAARLLGLSVRQLRWRIAKYGIAVERF
ncbi:MAG TPA: helix-turn-helix domain-containing protein, partial [Anaeromyxobacter sp.]